MNFADLNQKYGRHALVFAVILGWGLIIWSFFANGYAETWSRWHFPVEMPPFVDFRLLPSGAETFRSGIDPAVSNPNDPLEHLFNYPRIWYIFFYTGITQDDTVWIVPILLILFFATVFAFPEKLTVVDSLFMLSIIFSSAAVLLYERGNLDIAFFILCGLAIILVRKSPWWTVFTLSVAAIFKMFPFFGIGIFLKESKRNFFKYVLASALIFGVYFATNYKELSAMWSLTWRGMYLSYGDYIIFTLYEEYIRNFLLMVMSAGKAAFLLKVFPHLLALAVLAVAFWLGTRPKAPLGTNSEGNLTAFRMGAFIYIGTFLLGNNWDYRLSFLIFTIPQISHWLFSAGRQTKMITGLVFIFMLASCWYTAFYSLFAEEIYTMRFTTYDEIANWLLLMGLMYLVTLSAPQWVRSFSWNPFSRE